MKWIPFYLMLVSDVILGKNAGGGVTISREMHQRAQNNNGTTIPVCETSQCKRATSEMLSSMDPTADPCEDFHQYACGNFWENPNWLEEQFARIEQYLSEESPQEEYLGVFSKFYESCVSYEPDFEMFEEETTVRTFPSKNLTEIFTELVLSQSHPFIDVGVGIGTDSKYQMEIIPPGKSSLKSSIECAEEECLQVIKFRATYDLQEMHADYKTCMMNRTIEKVQRFVGPIEGFVKLREETRGRNHLSVTINDLNKRYSLIDWRSFFNGISRNISFGLNEVVQVHFPAYVDKVFTMMQNYSEDVLIQILYNFYVSNLRQNLVIPSRRRKYFCMNLASQLMPDITSLIVYKLLDHKTHFLNVQTKALFKEISESLNSAFERSSIDNKRKTSLQKKIGKIQLGMITSGDVRSVKINYGGVTVEYGAFFENLMKMLRVYRKTVYSLHGTLATPASLLNYFVSPFHKEPKTFYEIDYIVFHPAIYRHAMTTGPDFFPLATLGLHFARELAKHVDNTGRRFGVEGFDDDTTYDTLMDRTKMLLTFYLNDAYTVDGEKISLQVNDDEPLLNEMISDSVALKTIFSVFNKMNDTTVLPWISGNFNTRELFYILTAQEYCGNSGVADFVVNMAERRRLPTQVKIQNLVGNSMGFRETFRCVDGAAMLINDDLMTAFPEGEEFRAEYDDQYNDDE